MKLRTVVIEDEKPALNLIVDYVGKTPSLDLVASFQSGIEGLDFINRNTIDLVLLDIHLPEISGIEIATNILTNPMIVFTTANPDYAIEGYELDVLDYLLKPIVFPRFLKAVSKAVKQFELNKLEEVETPSTHNTAETESEKPSPSFMFVKVDNRRIKQNLDEVLYIEANGDYVSIHTTQNTAILSLQTMSQVLEKLPKSSFVRIHRSYIVNLKHVDIVEKDHLLIGDLDLTIGKSYRANFLKLVE